MKPIRCLTLLLLLGLPLVSRGQDRITAAIDTSARVVVPNSIHPAIALASVSKPVDPGLRMEKMILVLQPSSSRQSAMQAMLAQQQDPASPNFHKFMSPAQFGASFGVSQNDVDKVTSWLASSGFHIDEIAANHLSVIFSGNAAQVASAFATEIWEYVVHGETHHANALPVKIPMALSSVVQGVVKLNDFHSQTPAKGLKPLYTSGGSHYLVPADYGIIYNLDPIYVNGFTGSLQTIAVVGRSNVNLSDIATFRQDYGLPANPLTQVFATGTDPGVVTNGDDVEATLDVEWAGAIAPNASVKLVMAASSATTDGVDLAAQYAVDHNVASILSVSFGACETVLNNTFYSNLWQQAAAEGMSVFVSSGDSGAAGCDASSATAGTSKAVNGICSSPYSTCVGGTQFNDTANPGAYWQSSNNAVMGSAMGYIPEVAWNESGLAAGGSGLAASGGGASAFYLKPIWQIGLGVPADGRRDVPDVSMSAAQHDGYMIVYGGSHQVVSGTSAATPSFAAIMALISQKYGGAQGAINQVLYPLATASTQNGSPIFHDVVGGNNSVPGIAGYTATAGYDLATGLGSVDAALLVNNWTSQSGGFTFTGSAFSVNVSPGQNGSVTLNLADVGSFHSPVALNVKTLPPNTVATFAPATLSATGSSVLTFAASGAAISGTYPITIVATGGGFTRIVTVNLVVSVSTNCTLSAVPASLTMVQSQAVSTKLTCGASQGVFSGPLALSVSAAPAGISASFSPASLVAGTGVSTLTVNATSAAATGSFTLLVTATLPNSNPVVTTTVSVPVTISAAKTFTVVTSAASLSFPQGGSGTLMLTSAHQGAFNSSISYSVSGLPSTIAATFTSTTVAAPGDGTSSVTLQAASTISPGSYTMTILAVGAGLVLRIPISIQVTAAPAFTLTASAAVLTLRQSTAATVNTTAVTLNVGSLTNNFNLPVNLSVSGLPSGVTGVFLPATIAAPGSGASVLTLTASTTAVPGISTFTVAALGGTIARYVNVQLTTTPTATFTVSASVPSYSMIAGGTLNETIAVKGLYGFNSNVQLSTSLLPPGLAASFSSATVNGLNGTSTMTIKPAAALVAGSYMLTVVATDPITSNAQAATINLLVGSIVTTVTMPAAALQPSGSIVATITTVATSYTGNVALIVANLPPGVNYSLSNPFLAGSGSSTLTFSALPTVHAGAYTITIETVAGGITTMYPTTLMIN